jgi:hypothetical protein
MMIREFPPMSRNPVLALIVTLATISPCFGQDWAKKMFPVTSHDFGTVARGAKAEYRFVFENLFMEDVHIANAYSSCGCTSVRVENDTVKTYQKGAIVATFNTASFSGQRGATITVVIDRPYYAEVQLQDRGFIRTDVQVEPGSVQFGAIDQGTGYIQTAAINYAGGRSDWQITDVKSYNPHITAQVVETGRNYGQISYDLKVTVDKSAPAGFLNDHIMLVTNEGTQQIPVLVEGRVTPGVTVSPSSLYIGKVQPGEKVTKRLVVSGKKPFRILSVSCDDKSFQFDVPKEQNPSTLHQIPVTFVAGKNAGQVVKTIKIKTDQDDMTPEVSAFAVVATPQMPQ